MLRPIVVINKIDRPDARPHEVVDEVLDLFISLGASDAQADFPFIFASSRLGFATFDPAQPGDNIHLLMDMILEKIPGPDVDLGDPLQMLVTTLDWSDYTGRIAIGRVQSGTIRKGQSVVLMQAGDKITPSRVVSVFLFQDLGRVEVHEVDAGDICAVVGLENVEIGDTISDPQTPRALPRLKVDEPTLKMTFGVNTSPLAGREGKYLTSRHLRERLFRELERNVALRVEPIPGTEQFAVSGRGVLHLSVLIEIMRREQYELSIGKPQVIFKEIDGVLHEPFESLVVEVPTDRTGPVMELIGERRGQLSEMSTHNEYTFMIFSIPARGLIGLRTRLLNATQGTAIMHHRYEAYKPAAESIPGRATGVLVSTVARPGGGLWLRRLAAAGGFARGPQRRGLRRHDRRRKQPRRRHERQSHQGKEALQHAGSRPRPQHLIEARPASDLGRGTGVHRRGRVGRSNAEPNPPAENHPERNRPPPRHPGRGVGDQMSGIRGQDSVT